MSEKDLDNLSHDDSGEDFERSQVEEVQRALNNARINRDQNLKNAQSEPRQNKVRTKYYHNPYNDTANNMDDTRSVMTTATVSGQYRDTNGRPMQLVALPAGAQIQNFTGNNEDEKSDFSELTYEEIDKLSSAIDSGVEAGAGISYINFELSQESQNKYKAEALKQASEDAMIKADSIASGFNKKAGKLLSVQTSDFGYYPWNVYSSGGVSYREDALMAKEVAMNIQPSEQDVTATITATFKLR